MPHVAAMFVPSLEHGSTGGSVFKAELNMAGGGAMSDDDYDYDIDNLLAENAALRERLAAYDREHDETPADEAWFRDVLGWESCSHTNYYYSTSTSDGLRLLWDNMAKRLVADYDEYVHIPVADNPTCGQVRRIASGLGIELKEGKE